MAAALIVRGALLCGSIIVIRKLTGVLNKAFLKDKIHTEASQREREDQSATTTSTMMNLKEVGREFKRSVMDEGQEILKRLDDLLGRTSFLGLKDGVPPRSLQRLHAPLVVKESDVVGRDGEKEEIIELLLSADTGRKNLSVIPIVGMGGIGKTTLAQLVYKDSRVQQHFDLKVWVTISEEFDVFQITKRIYKEVTSQECETGELFVLQSKLNEALAGKRFFFVLDDVWNENYGRWDSLKSSFQSEAHGSRIIVTTRSKDVVSTMSKGVMHELKLMSDKECWLVFEKHAFDDSAEATAELQEIGLEIVKRCKGLPLAIKSVAGLLRSTLNPEEWRKILNSDIWKLQFRENLKNDIVPAIWLSYHFLPPVLKRCFAYCSIFPKDYEFEESDKEKIILLWMAEGLLTPKDGERMEDVGKAYLQALISRSFFQPSGTDASAMVMHDLVHDLAMFISGEFCFSCGDSNDLSNLGTKSCHFSYRKRKGSDDLMKLGAVSQSREKKLKSLRTLLAFPLSFAYVFDKRDLELHELFLKVGGCLRVLSLSQSSITELPDSIGNMKYLRYLDLSWTSIKELPNSICTLYNLQTLLLLGCSQLAQLPTRLAALVNLRHLDITHVPIIELPDSICTLYNLQTLLLSGCENLERLPTSLAGLVNLRHLDLTDTFLKELPDSICTLYNLQTLLLSGCFLLAELPTRLAGLVNLRHLHISGTPLKELPDSICTFYNLQTLLSGCHQLAQLPTRLAALVNLRHLEIACTDLKELPDSICTLYNLQTLILSQCYELAQLPTRLAGLVNLRHLDITHTPITELPDSICTLYNLQTLLLSGCENLERLPTSLAGLVNLRHLDLTDTFLKELPDSICTLYNLQTLLLSGCFLLAQLPTRLAGLVNLRHLEITDTRLKELPDSICTLYNLQTLLLSGCEALEQLPTRLAALVNLRHLDISYTPLKEMPPQMCEMKSLQRLSDFVLGENDGRRIKELGEFSLLEGRLRISGLEYIADVKDVLEANLKDKKLLSKLILEWNWLGPSNITSSQQEREVLEALQPHKNLKELTIFRYRGQIFPDSFLEGGWLPTALTHISILDCKKLKGLNGIAFWHLTCLQSLRIENCGELECLPQEGLPLSLSSLTISRCRVLKWRCWEDWLEIQHIREIRIW